MARALRWLVNLIVAVTLTAGGALPSALAGARHHHPRTLHHRGVLAHRSVVHRSPARPSPAPHLVGATASGTMLPAGRAIHEARVAHLHLLFALAAPSQTRGPPRPSTA
jgi:hypothetical protein